MTSRTPRWSASQQARFAYLVLETCILVVASYLAFHSFLPPPAERSFWFFTALLGLALGHRLDTPFFATPADTVLYALPALIAVLSTSPHAETPGGNLAQQLVAILCVALLVLAATAILLKDATSRRARLILNITLTVSSELGVPRIVFSSLCIYAMLSFHWHSSSELGCVGIAWALLLANPVEAIHRLAARLWASRQTQPNEVFGRIFARLHPHVVDVETTQSSIGPMPNALVARSSAGSPVYYRPLGLIGGVERPRLRLVDTGVAAQDIGPLGPEVIAVTNHPADLTDVLGVVAVGTTPTSLFFEVAPSVGTLSIGSLVETEIDGQRVLHQVVSGVTTEARIDAENRVGLAVAQATTVGTWDAKRHAFKPAIWLSPPNSRVSKPTANEGASTTNTLGVFPGTTLPVSIKQNDSGNPIGLSEMVTHNTAILGVLGVGKSTLSLELVERMILSGIKVLILDMTGEYRKELKPYLPSDFEQGYIKSLKEAAKANQHKVNNSPALGGSAPGFRATVDSLARDFVSDASHRLLVINPLLFDVDRQDSKVYGAQAAFANLTATEIAQYFAQACLSACASLGQTDSARLCLVLEEAHSLVPEWNSAAADVDRQASNGTARALLQGRKFGMGCLVIAQRTANVSKTILNQCNTIFAMRMLDETGMSYLSTMIGREYAESMAKLAERHAVFFGRGSASENPIIFRVRERKETLAQLRTRQADPSSPVGTAVS